jgi:hypothetical protein
VTPDIRVNERGDVYVRRVVLTGHAQGTLVLGPLAVLRLMEWAEELARIRAIETEREE